MAKQPGFVLKFTDSANRADGHDDTLPLVLESPGPIARSALVAMAAKSVKGLRGACSSQP
jgi:hypothetical protein